MDNFNNSDRIKLNTVKISLIFSMLFLTSCMTVKTESTAPIATTPIESAETTCRALYQQIDAVIDNAGARDHGSSPVQGFPYLRTSRLLASFSDELSDDTPQWSAWVGHMAELDAQMRELELRNLSSTVMGRQKDTSVDELNRCRDLLIKIDLMKPQQRARLRDVVRVPDDYVSWRQVVGLYPITAPLVSVGISAWHSKTRDTFATPLALLPVMGELIRWIPISTATIATTDALLAAKPLNSQQVKDILEQSRDALGIPLPTNAELDQLFATFAPLWEVDVVDENDYIGRVSWENGPTVNIIQPTLYRKVSHTRFGNQVLLQLNYIAWFPARAGNDIYAGKLDGINWRVTLGPDGKPWLYDAIHNCGCYHKFFLSQRLRLRKDLPSAYFESPLLPQPAPEQQPLVLRIAQRTHFIQRIYHDGDLSAPSSAVPVSRSMMWEDYDVLRSLPSANGFRSLFGAHGVIAETQRSERFLLWPMGIRSPGAMRVWGRHATAFNGRRHFDDAFLLETLFEEVQ